MEQQAQSMHSYRPSSLARSSGIAGAHARAAVFVVDEEGFDLLPLGWELGPSITRSDHRQTGQRVE